MKEFKTPRYSVPWYVDDFHAWKDVYSNGKTEFKFNSKPILNKNSSVATIGSCFAQELAAAMDSIGIKSSFQLTNLLHYNTTSIKQQFQLAFDQWPEYSDENIWKVSDGYVHPFNDYYTTYPSVAELSKSAERIANSYKHTFMTADIIVITLGLIECWRSPVTGNVFRSIPHPEVMDTVEPEFFRLTTAQMMADLCDIYRMIKDNNPSAEIVITTSPIPLHNTFTNTDVRIANSESKSRIRAAVSEFIETHPDVNYMYSYELVMDAKNKFDYWKEDNRHIHRHAVDYIMSQFIHQYSDGSVKTPQVDTSWITK